jgi:biotin carboxylase
MMDTAAPAPAPHVLVVGGGRDIPARLRALGAQTTFLCRLGVVESIHEPRSVAGIHGLRASAPNADWVALARTLHDLHRFSAVASFSEKDQDKAADVAEALGLPWHTPETVTLVHDKSAMRERLAKAGVDETTNGLVHSAGEVIDFGESYGWPVVVKPASGTGSSGVTIVAGPEYVHDAWGWAGTAQWTESAAIIVEQFLPGREYSVESLSEGGVHVPVAIVEKHTLPTHCVEVGHVTPALLPEAAGELIRGLVRDALTALGVRAGVTHTEVMLCDDGLPRVIETHLRPGGDDIPLLVRDGLGVDLIDLLVRQTLGERVLGEVREQLSRSADRAGADRGDAGAGAAAIWFAVPEAAGRVVALAGLDEAAGMPGVVSVEPEISIGETTGGVHDTFSRAVAVRAVASDAQQALRAARAASEAIRVFVEPVGAASGGEER